MWRNNAQRGFIALISALVLSAMLLIGVASESLGGFFARTSVLDAESKARSEALADACSNMVLSKLTEDASYAGGETITVGSDSCTIAGGASGDPRTFAIEAVYNRAYTNRLVTIDVGSAGVIASIEVATF